MLPNRRTGGSPASLLGRAAKRTLPLNGYSAALFQIVAGELNQYGRTGHQTAVIEYIFGVMKSMSCIGIRIVSGAETELSAGAIFREHVGEVL